MRKINLLILFVIITGFGYAKVKLPAVIAANMVLQQNSKANLWGEAKKSAIIKVTTSWDNKTYNTSTDENGKWKLAIKTPKAGGPFNLVFDDGEKLELNNILVGEVWVCSGQSNMEMPLEGFKNQPILNSESIIANAKNDNLRVFKVMKAFSSSQKNDCEGSWMLSTPENAPQFSAVAFQYAQMLQQKLGVPIGIIVTSWGGTPIQAWMGENLNSFKKEDRLKDGNITASSPHVLYNAMIVPLQSFTIKGFLWYQGESDRINPEPYDDKMAAMVKEWRENWHKGNLPFYFVQIAPFAYKDSSKNNVPLIREAQLNASKRISNSAMVVTLDIGAENTIHPPDKTTAAERLLNCALGNTYKKHVKYNGPDYKSLKIKEGKALVKFKNARGLALQSQNSINFEIAGADKVFYKAEAQVKGKSIALSSDNVKVPVAVRYGFTNYLVGDVFNGDGLPASPFRTDNW